MTERGTVERTQIWNAAARLFVGWRAGQRGALDELVRSLTPLLWHVARAYGLSTERAEDVVQNTWMTLLRSRDSILDPQAIGGWLITTTRRESYRVARAESRSRPTDDVESVSVVPPQRSAEAEAISHLDNEDLWSGLQQLSDRCQRLLRVVAFADRPDYAAIAQDLGMAVGSIGPTRGRCLKQLRALIAARADGPAR